MNTISVIVPTHDRPALLREAITSIVAQSRATFEVEIIVVDDGSNPPVDEATLRREFGNNISVLRNDVSRGLAWVRHQGAEAATGEIVTHLDDDDLFAPQVLQDAYLLLREHPQVGLLFLGVEGFGSRAEYFNRVQREAVRTVIEAGDGAELGGGVVMFGPNFLRGLFRTIPIAFQRVAARRTIWNAVSALRRRAYMSGIDGHDDAAARRQITGPLRDSEWALYAAVACVNTMLLNRPCYLQRCEGQGLVSQSAQRARHIGQGVLIMSKLLEAATKLPEFAQYRLTVQEGVAKNFFDAAYYYFHQGNRRRAWLLLAKAIRTDFQFSHLKFGVRTLLPRTPSGD